MNRLLSILLISAATFNLAYAQAEVLNKRQSAGSLTYNRATVDEVTASAIGFIYTHDRILELGFSRISLDGINQRTEYRGHLGFVLNSKGWLHFKTSLSQTFS